MEAIADSRIARAPEKWTHVRWTILILGAFAVHAALVFFLSKPQAGLEPSRADTSSLRLMAGTPEGALVSRELTLLDPALFGSANAQTYSGLAWIRRPVFEFQLASWTEPPAYLQFPEGVWPSIPAQEAAAKEDSFVEKLTPATTRPALRLSPPPSRLCIDQLPGGRPLVYADNLPAQAFQDVLGNSVVQAAVDPHGIVVSARLISRSGSKKADEDALSITKHARFKPQDPSDFAPRQLSSLDWAILDFQWFTTDRELSAGSK